MRGKSNMASVRFAVLGIGRLISENVNKCGNVRWPRHSIFRERWHSSQRSMCAMPTGEVKQRNPDVQTSVGDESESEKKLKLEIDSLTKEAASLTEKSQELDDKYKRALADGENMRKRLMKQIEDAKIFGIQGFCKDLLEVADILSKATECVPKEEVKDSNPHLKNLYEGLMMTDNELQKVFKRHGLVPVSPLNEKFNPNLHEALFQQEVKGKPAGTVVVVSKIGYKLQERCIRPALVGVAT